MSVSVSIVIPVYNERENIGPLAAELKSALVREAAWEVIWVDDGSTDGSWEELLKAAAPEKNFRLVRFARNSGQTAALSAGIARAQGEFTVTLDADRQNDPSDIPLLLAEARGGLDVVSGWRKKRMDARLTRVVPSLIANKLISFITGVYLHDYGCTLKAYRTAPLKNLELYGEMHRFLPALLGYAGARIAEMEVNHRPRAAGESKYGLARTFKVLLDLLTVKFMGEFLGKPIYVFGGIAAALMTSSLLMAGFTLYRKLYCGVFVKDQPLFLVAIFFALAGLQLALMGLLAELTVRTYYRANRKPPYHVSEEK